MENAIGRIEMPGRFVRNDAITSTAQSVDRRLARLCGTPSTSK